MEKWRRVLLIGAVPGLAVTAIDSWTGGIPYEIIIPIEFVSIALIFAGLIMRKKQRACEALDA